MNVFFDNAKLWKRVQKNKDLAIILPTKTLSV
jgi:hypothetical protein